MLWGVRLASALAAAADERARLAGGVQSVHHWLAAQAHSFQR